MQERFRLSDIINTPASLLSQWLIIFFSLALNFTAILGQCKLPTVSFAFSFSGWHSDSKRNWVKQPDITTLLSRSNAPGVVTSWSKIRTPIMDHGFHMLSSVQCNLLRHLQVLYSTVIVQNNVASLDGSEIWIINVSTPQPKSVPVPMYPHHSSETMVPTALSIWGV